MQDGPKRAISGFRQPREVNRFEMTEVEDLLLDLPEDPELQFVIYEQRLCEQMWERIGSSQYVNEQDQKLYYLTKVMAFHDAHDLKMLTKPHLPRRAEDFDRLFDEFLDSVIYWSTQIEVRHANRLRPISTILSLTDDIRSQIHTYIGKIREAIAPIELKPAKKEALYAKLNALADEVDRDRTKGEALMAFTIELASTGGEAARELKPARKLADSIADLFGRAKDFAETLGLPSPADPRRIEPPRKQLPPSEAGNQDDEIPF